MIEKVIKIIIGWFMFTSQEIDVILHGAFEKFVSIDDFSRYRSHQASIFWLFKSHLSDLFTVHSENQQDRFIFNNQLAHEDCLAEQKSVFTAIVNDYLNSRVWASSAPANADKEKLTKQVNQQVTEFFTGYKKVLQQLYSKDPTIFSTVFRTRFLLSLGKVSIQKLSFLLDKLQDSFLKNYCKNNEDPIRFELLHYFVFYFFELHQMTQTDLYNRDGCSCLAADIQEGTKNLKFFSALVLSSYEIAGDGDKGAFFAFAQGLTSPHWNKEFLWDFYNRKFDRKDVVIKYVKLVSKDWSALNFLKDLSSKDFIFSIELLSQDGILPWVNRQQEKKLALDQLNIFPLDMAAQLIQIHQTVVWHLSQLVSDKPISLEALFAGLAKAKEQYFSLCEKLNGYEEIRIEKPFPYFFSDSIHEGFNPASFGPRDLLKKVIKEFDPNRERLRLQGNAREQFLKQQEQALEEQSLLLYIYREYLASAAQLEDYLRCDIGPSTSEEKTYKTYLAAMSKDRLDKAIQERQIAVPLDQICHEFTYDACILAELAGQVKNEKNQIFLTKLSELAQVVSTEKSQKYKKVSVRFLFNLYEIWPALFENINQLRNLLKNKQIDSVHFLHEVYCREIKNVFNRLLEAPELKDKDRLPLLIRLLEEPRIASVIDVDLPVSVIKKILMKEYSEIRSFQKIYRDLLRDGRDPEGMVFFEDFSLRLFTLPLAKQYRVMEHFHKINLGGFSTSLSKRILMLCVNYDNDEQITRLFFRLSNAFRYHLDIGNFLFSLIRQDRNDELIIPTECEAGFKRLLGLDNPDKFLEVFTSSIRHNNPNFVIIRDDREKCSWAFDFLRDIAIVCQSAVSKELRFRPGYTYHFYELIINEIDFALLYDYRLMLSPLFNDIYGYFFSTCKAEDFNVEDYGASDFSFFKQANQILFVLHKFCRASTNLPENLYLFPLFLKHIKYDLGSDQSPAYKAYQFLLTTMASKEGEKASQLMESCVLLSLGAEDAVDWVLGFQWFLKIYKADPDENDVKDVMSTDIAYQVSDHANFFVALYRYQKETGCFSFDQLKTNMRIFDQYANLMARYYKQQGMARNQSSVYVSPALKFSAEELTQIAFLKERGIIAENISEPKDSHAKLIGWMMANLGNPPASCANACRLA